MSRILRFLVQVATGFELAPTDLANEVYAFSQDGLLIQQIIRLSDFVNLAEAGNLISNAAMNQLSNTLDGTNWIVKEVVNNNPVYPTIAAITGEVSFVVGGGTQIEELNAALAFLEKDEEIQLEKLLSSYDQLAASARYHYQIAEGKLFQSHPVYQQAKAHHDATAGISPSQGAVAGVYSATDRDRGVWKAPANVSLGGIVGPAVMLTNTEQDTLNVDPSTGKSINAIRAFSGKGTLIWGARTLTGNDSEWRYVPVRRFFIYVEESIAKASQPFVFEPNNAITWVRVKAMITNFLINQWKAGALQGNQAEDAFFVKVGVGQTMTQQDVLDGKMVIEVGLAAVRPAEYIILRFTHHMNG